MAENVTTAAPATDTKAEATPAKAAPTTTPEATETIKVNGKEVKVTKAQLVAMAQKGYFADQKLKSMDVIQGKTKALIESLKTPEGLLSILKDPALGANPKEVFKKLMASDVIDDELKDEIAKWTYDNVVQAAKFSPEEIERNKKLSDYERLKKQEEDRKKQELTQKKQSEIQQVYQAVRSEVTKQITADKTFPQVEGAIRSVIETLRAMNKNGAPITPENVTKALTKVKNDFVVYQQAILDGDEDPESLISRIGEARALKISKALVARLKAKAAAKPHAKAEENGSIRQKVTDRIDKKLGRTPYGYHVMDV